MFNQIILFRSSLWCSLWSLAEPFSQATEVMRATWLFCPHLKGQGYLGHRAQDCPLHSTPTRPQRTVPPPSERILSCESLTFSSPSSHGKQEHPGKTAAMGLLDSQHPGTQTLGKGGGGQVWSLHLHPPPSLCSPWYFSLGFLLPSSSCCPPSSPPFCNRQKWVYGTGLGFHGHRYIELGSQLHQRLSV